MKKEIKDIHIGSMLLRAVNERMISEERICKFLACKSSDLPEMYATTGMNTELLLRWSKLLEYDFFRIYSQHLIFYSPPIKAIISNANTYNSLPKFRKNIYTNEVIDFFLELIATGEKTIAQILSEYGVPKSTLYRWLNKRESSESPNGK
jgi:Helix-turn-helix domain of resolvase